MLFRPEIRGNATRRSHDSSVVISETSLTTTCIALFLLVCSSCSFHQHFGVEATTVLPLPRLTFQPFAYSQPFANYSFNEANLNVNQEVLGVTLQVALEDCTQGSRWYLLPEQPIVNKANLSDVVGLDAVWGPLTVEYDITLCALFVYSLDPSVSSSSSAPWSVNISRNIAVSNLLRALRSVWFYNAAANNGTVTMRASWSYWMELGGFVMSSGQQQHMYGCVDRYGTPLNYGNAVTACQGWLQTPNDPSSVGASLISLPTYRLQDLMNAIRRRVTANYIDPTTGSSVGFVTLLGIYGTKTTWDNGAPLSYKNFATANPAANFPTVMDDSTQWKSVLPAEQFPYCCETTSTGPTQEVANGFVQFASNVSSANDAVLSTETLLNVLKAPSDVYYNPFYPFRTLSRVPTASTLVFGFTASFHREDCDGSFRFVLADNQSSPFLVAVHDDVCSISVSRRTQTAVPLTVAEWTTAIYRISIIDVRGLSEAKAASNANISKRLVWGFVLGDGSTSWTMGGDPIPHYYACLWGSSTFADANVACGLRAGGRFEPYIATPQYQWEQDLLEDLTSRGNLTFDDVWIGIDTAIGTTVFSNGDPMLIGADVSNNRFSNWGVGQPSLDNSPAVLSANNGKWTSRARTSTLSYCCEMTSIVDRNASGIVRITFRSSTSVVPNPSALQPTSTFTAQRLHRFQPLQYLRNQLFDRSVANITDIYGVSLQLPLGNCTTSNGQTVYTSGGTVATAVLPRVFPTASIPIPEMLCPSQTDPYNLAGATNCVEGTTTSSLRSSACLWTVTRSDNASKPLTASQYLTAIEGLELRIARMSSSTSPVQQQQLLLGWALWPHPPKLPLSSPGLLIGTSLSFHGVQASWPLNRMAFDPTTGATFLCPSPYDTGVGLLYATFVDAMNYCRDWTDDAYLASLVDASEQRLLETARNLTHYSSAGSNAANIPNMWIGLQRNRTTWMNGDALRYTNWAFGSPTAIGPVQLQPDGEWLNVPVLTPGTALPQQAPFCCKRNGFNQETGRLLGTVRINPPTISETVTQVTNSPSHSDQSTVSKTVSSSRTFNKTESLTITVSRSGPEATVTHPKLSSTDTHSIRHTTSAQRTTQPPTVTPSVSASQQDSSQSITATLNATVNASQVFTLTRNHSVSDSYPTLSTTNPLPPIARIDWEQPLTLSFKASDIRSSDVTRRRIVIESVFTTFIDTFNTSSWTTYFEFTLASTSPSFKSPAVDDLTALGGTARLVDSATQLSSTTLLIQLSQIENYFPAADEQIVLLIQRSVTTMTADQPPAQLPTHEFTIWADSPDDYASVAARVVTTVLAAASLAAPSAVRDLQFVHLLGALNGGTCSRARIRGIYLDGIRVTTTAHWSTTSPISLWVGSGAILVAFLIGHLVVWVVHSCVRSSTSRRRADRYEVEDDLSSSSDGSDNAFWMSTRMLHYPSLSILALRAFMVSVITMSLMLVYSSRQGNDFNNYDTSSFEFIGGVCTIAVLGTVTLVVFGWVCCGKAVYKPLDEKITQVQTATTKFMAPQGAWVFPRDDQDDGISAKKRYPRRSNRRQDYPRHHQQMNSVPRHSMTAPTSQWWLYAEYSNRWWLVVDWGMAWLLGWVPTYSPTDTPNSSCTELYSSLAAIFYVIALLVATLRPYITRVGNVLGFLQYCVLGSIVLCVVFQLDEPDGPSAGGLNALRWILVVLGPLRSFSVIMSVQLAIISDPNDAGVHTTAQFNNSQSMRQDSGALAYFTTPMGHEGGYRLRGASSHSFDGGRNQRHTSQRQSWRTTTSPRNNQQAPITIQRDVEDDNDSLEMWDYQEHLSMRSARGGGNGRRNKGEDDFNEVDDVLYDDQFNHQQRRRSSASDHHHQRRSSSEQHQQYSSHRASRMTPSAMDQRMFSMGSMRRFGSSERVRVVTVDSEGESGSSSDDRGKSDDWSPKRQQPSPSHGPSFSIPPPLIAETDDRRNAQQQGTVRVEMNDMSQNHHNVSHRLSRMFSKTMGHEDDDDDPFAGIESNSRKSPPPAAAQPRSPRLARLESLFGGS